MYNFITGTLYFIGTVVSTAAAIILTMSNSDFTLSARAYIKSVEVGGGWRFLVRAINLPFKLLPKKFFGSDNHCRDAMLATEADANRVKAKVARIREIERLAHLG